MCYISSRILNIPIGYYQGRPKSRNCFKRKTHNHLVYEYILTHVSQTPSRKAFIFPVSNKQAMVINLFICFLSFSPSWTLVYLHFAWTRKTGLTRRPSAIDKAAALKNTNHNHAEWDFFCVFFSSTTALLSGTLKTYHKTSCDSENVTLSCPRGTSISIEMAQYEKNENGRCLLALVQH